MYLALVSTRVEAFPPGLEPFPPRWKPFHPGGNLSTWFETFPPGWKPSHRVETFPPGWKLSHPGGNLPNGNLPTWLKTFPPGWKRFRLIGNVSTQNGRNCLLNYATSQLIPERERFKPGGKVSNQVERFPSRWKCFKPGGKVSSNARYKLVN